VKIFRCLCSGFITAAAEFFPALIVAFVVAFAVDSATVTQTGFSGLLSFIASPAKIRYLSVADLY
jgi:hypothetical protein